MATGENSQLKSLWSQSVFDSLFAEARSEGSDATLRELLGSLGDRGYTMNMVIKKVELAHGEQAALRVRQAALRAGRVDALPRPAKKRYRQTHCQRLSREAAELWRTADNWWFDMIERIRQMRRR